MLLIGEVSRTRRRPTYSKPWSKACHEKSAEVIVPAEDSGREGLNPAEVNNRKTLSHERKNAENINTE